MLSTTLRTAKAIVVSANSVAGAASDVMPDQFKSALSSTAQVIGNIADKFLPRHITGALTHSKRWLESKDEDFEFINPNFAPITGLKGEKGIALYLIHGTGDRTGGFEQFAKDILPTLPGAIKKVRVIHFAGRFEGKDIEHFAAQLAEKIKKNEDERILLVGHSRGGLVASLCVTNFLNHVNTLKLAVVTIGTPYGGTSLASLPGLPLLSKSVSEMQEYSAFLKQLDELITQAKIPHYCYALMRDWVVLKSHACRPEAYKHNLVEFPNEGHLSAINSIYFRLHFTRKSQEIIDEVAPELHPNAPPLVEVVFTVNADVKDQKDLVTVNIIPAFKK